MKGYSRAVVKHMRALYDSLSEKDRRRYAPVEEQQRWTNRSPASLAEELVDQGFAISADTVRRLLTQELELGRRQAVKNLTTCTFAERDEQFCHIAHLRAEFERRDWPVISIDTKQKEILGDFFREGQAYTNGRVLVHDHDFVTAKDRLVPYGVYDTRRNEAFMLLARGADTSELACDAIARWWELMGRERYCAAPQALLLCDCGGSNGYRRHRFKEELCRLASRMHCDLRVAHYPPGCSKYNPIEHRLFCHVTRSLRAVVLRTMEIARRFISGTTTSMGLRVVAEITRHMYALGQTATREFLEHYPILHDRFLPQLNYLAPWINELVTEVILR